MAQIGPVPLSAVDENGNKVNQGWAQFFSSAYNILFAVSQSGTTVNRPIKFLWVGRPYFDTTLGRPIWYNGTIWVFSDGTPA